MPGVEHFTLASTDDGWRLEGTVLVAFEGCPLRVQYSVACGRDWTTRNADVEMWDGRQIRRLRLGVDSQRRWRSGGEEHAALRGCVDIDLGFSPSTTTLAIGRLDLAVGASAPIVAAWIRFPDLDAKAVPQTYTRLSERRYRYESGGGTFVREIDVDDLGLVTDYPGVWKREGSA